MAEIFMGIGLLGMLTSVVLIMYSIIVRNGKTHHYVVTIVVAFIVFGFGMEFDNGLLGIYEFIGTSGFILSLMFAWLFIRALIQKNGKALKNFIFAILAFVVMYFSFGFASDIEKSVNKEIQSILKSKIIG